MNQQPDLSAMAIRQPKGAPNMPTGADDFDERAKANSENVSKIHEFRRQNIKDYEAPNENLFDYNSEEFNVKYNALKIENLFRFQNSMKAVQWGIFVGGLFGMHRYYRLRDMSAALNWFCTVSGISIFNIWISYGLQDFVTQHGTTKGLQTAARDEYHLNAYKHYMEKTQNQVSTFHRGADPILRNSQSESMDIFINDIEKELHRTYESENLKRDEILSFADNKHLPKNMFKDRKITRD